MIRTVMVPGTLCDTRLFGPLVARLPGHDVTVAAIASFDTVAAAAAAVLASAPARFLSVGFSLGGFVALEMLRTAPDRLSGLVLIAGNAHPDRPELAAPRRRQAADARAHGIDAFVAANCAAWGLAALPSVARQVADMAVDLGAEVLARQTEMNIARPDLRATAAAARVPILVVAGGEDPLCPAERYAAAAAAPGARLVVLPGRGHYLPLEAPDEVAAVIAGLELAA